jgi:2'-phosphotransferase
MERDRVATSKELTRILRHRGKSMGLDMRPDGFARLQDVLRLPRLRGITVAVVQDVVDSCPKRRFEMRTEGGVVMIRATQGHSIAGIDDEALLREVTDPASLPVAVHGTFSRFLPAILVSAALAL